MAAKDAEEMIEEADQNGDGKIDYKGTMYTKTTDLRKVVTLHDVVS